MGKDFIFLALIRIAHPVDFRDSLELYIVPALTTLSASRVKAGSK